VSLQVFNYACCIETSVERTKYVSPPQDSRLNHRIIFWVCQDGRKYRTEMNHSTNGIKRLGIGADFVWRQGPQLPHTGVGENALDFLQKIRREDQGVIWRVGDCQQARSG
jgi:hypothetical protein